MVADHLIGRFEILEGLAKHVQTAKAKDVVELSQRLQNCMSKGNRMMFVQQLGDDGMSSI
jgi:hypothetical protein